MNRDIEKNSSQHLSLPKGIWALGFVSMFMDISSEAVHGLLPVFLVSVLGASTTSVGILEGVAEATVMLVKFFSGVISDYFQKRKRLVFLGYFMGTLSKPLFALSGTVGFVFFARVFDRIGKGVRGAPRDALIADITPKELRGRAYGLRQSMDTIGAFIGPLLAIGLMLTLDNDYRKVFWIATIPGLIALIIILLGVHDKSESVTATKQQSIELRDLKKFNSKFWMVVLIGGIFNLSRFSEAFLILRLKEVGLGQDYAPLVLIIMNIVYALAAYPIGYLSDRIKREYFLVFGLFFLLVANFILANNIGLIWGFIGIASWGLHLGFTQGIFSAMIADSCPEAYRGSAFGLFNIVGAITLLSSSVLAGVLWDHWGSYVTFNFSGSVGLLSLIPFLLYILIYKKN